MNFDRISRHFRSIRNFDFFPTKWLPAAILDDRKSLSIAFLAISDQYATFFCSQNGLWRPFCMTENNVWSHFSPFQINTTSFFVWFFSKWPPAAVLEFRFVPKTIGLFHYVLSMAMPNMKLIDEFMTQLETSQAFWAFLYKMAARGHFVFPIDAKNHRVLVIWDLNGCGEYEFDRCICDKVMTCTSVGPHKK